MSFRKQNNTIPTVLPLAYVYVMYNLHRYIDSSSSRITCKTNINVYCKTLQNRAISGKNLAFSTL